MKAHNSQMSSMQAGWEKCNVMFFGVKFTLYTNIVADRVCKNWRKKTGLHGNYATTETVANTSLMVHLLHKSYNGCRFLVQCSLYQIIIINQHFQSLTIFPFKAFAHCFALHGIGIALERIFTMLHMRSMRCTILLHRLTICTTTTWQFALMPLYSLAQPLPSSCCSQKAVAQLKA